MTDYSEISVQLYPTVRDLLEALRVKDYKEAYRLAFKLEGLSGDLAEIFQKMVGER